MTVIKPSKFNDLVEKPYKLSSNGIDIIPEKLYTIPKAAVFLWGKERHLVSDYFFDKFEAYSIDPTNFKDVYLVKDCKKELEPLTKKIGEGVKEKFWKIQKNTTIEAIFPKVTIPKDKVAIVLPRSTFNRLGAMKVPTALFDSGFHGHPSQTWFFPYGAIIHVNEAWGQIIYMEADEPDELYDGTYQEKKGG